MRCGREKHEVYGSANRRSWGDGKLAAKWESAARLMFGESRKQDDQQPERLVMLVADDAVQE
jgi:hypothetical protein